MSSRAQVYAAIDTERTYQDALAKASAERFGTSFGHHEIPSYLLFMQQYLDLATARASMDWSGDCYIETLKIIRKIVALGVACMEEHGAIDREHVSASEIQSRISGMPT